MNGKKAKELRRKAAVAATNKAPFQLLVTPKVVTGALDKDGNPISMSLPITSSWQEGTSRHIYQGLKQAA